MNGFSPDGNSEHWQTVGNPEATLNFEAAPGRIYQGPTQKIRSLSEYWFGQAAYCPSCGHLSLDQYPANKPVADFFCSRCGEQFELKSQGRAFGAKVSDGAYRTMIERLMSSTNPNLFLLQYDPHRLAVINLLVIYPDSLKIRVGLLPTLPEAILLPP